MNTSSTNKARTRTLYRSRKGMIFGVCKGLADYAQINPIWLRLGLLIAAFSTVIMPVLFLYLLAAILMRPEPAFQPVDESDWEFYHSYGANRSTALHRLKTQFESLDRRIRRMETQVTDKTFDWERRFRES